MSSPPTSFRRLPAHPGLPLVGNTWQFVKDPLGFLRQLQARYERAVRVSLVGRDITVLFTAEDSRQVLQENNRNYQKSEAYRVLAIFLGNGLLTSEGDFWRRQRKLAQPAFYKQRLALMADMMAQQTQQLLSDWQTHDPAQPRNISADMLGLTLNIVTRALFSTDVGERVAGISAALDDIMHYADHALKSFVQVPLKYPTPRNVRFRKAVAKVEAIIYDIIQNRRQQKIKYPELRYDDLLDMLMDARDEETGESMSDQQLRDEVTTIFMAGHETTANALSWALYLLAQHPDVAARVRSEAHEVLGEAGVPTFDSARRLTYTLQVVQEAMRLYPPAWIVGRRALEVDYFGEYEQPKDGIVLVSPYLLHRNQNYWDRPDVFDPERFSEAASKARPSYAYLPFGGGPRLCIGNNFALLEMQIVLALLVRAFDFQLLTSGHHVAPEPMVTIRPQGGLRLRIRTSFKH
ncbi:cytochrome P450 [Rhabdobacter roseus]|uniref:Cytochrome P450 n=1 Tax=Rhabdobacter roseus TaxID=1655419 RepID=A0A840TYT6_9BACT|nr:cytochrome P450 [Rhabdobacter roseus]MBB5285358.1 cytochrome P450 [Rhabdobacter roseus]